MTNPRISFWKTTSIATASALSGIAVLLAGLGLGWTRFDTLSWFAYFVLGAALLFIGLITAWLILIAVGGMIALRRDTLEAQGRPYAQYARRESVRDSMAAKWSAAFLRRFGSREDRDKCLKLRPGELVEVRTLGEIMRTLDSNGTLDCVPFMPEMAAYCGKRARVFRRIDKLNDWINSTGLKRMRNLVLLEEIRCDGSEHGGCQSNCHLRWHEAWLRRVSSSAPPATAPNLPKATTELIAELRRLAKRNDEATAGVRYICQATALTAGGVPLYWQDPRHYARDLLTGNVRPWPFFVGVALACFNWIQQYRGGVVSAHHSLGITNTSPHAVLNLRPGELVRVKPKHLIEITLNNRRRNRGLWFDRDMLRFCGGVYRVRARVERVIVEKTGELRQLTNPCIILEGCTATGEYLAFNPENEHIFWREIWLERVTPAVDHTVTGPAGIRTEVVECRPVR